jgi:hypothetical protein
MEGEGLEGKKKTPARPSRVRTRGLRGSGFSLPRLSEDIKAHSQAVLQEVANFLAVEQLAGPTAKFPNLALGYFRPGAVDPVLQVGDQPATVSNHDRNGAPQVVTLQPEIPPASLDNLRPGILLPPDRPGRLTRVEPGAVRGFLALALAL